MILTAMYADVMPNPSGGKKLQVVYKFRCGEAENESGPPVGRGIRKTSDAHGFFVCRKIRFIAPWKSSDSYEDGRLRQNGLGVCQVVCHC